QRQALATFGAQANGPGGDRPLVELRQDPAFLLAHEALDVAPGRAHRRRNLQAVRVDRQSERAPAAAYEAVFHLAPGETDQVSAFCCSSIHALASWLTAFGSRLAASIGGPIRTVMVPARLRNALRGHSRPALCATGTTGAPAAQASHAPPGWYSRCTPGATRVPSGNTTTQKPCARRSRPRRAIVRSARMPRERLIAIGLISARPQPKNGIQSSSRFSTCTCGGKMSWNAIVSHADWCLARMTAGREGRCSRPSTRHSMPRMARAMRITSRDQPEIRR